ncbi:uncharacterized protein LOC120629452 [Pararge aegeria]|uniref:uncharacterized protein LOC120629452 n=1 Tax=Pararge aegeria TaxID=116150 RepID=UPI0019D0EA75|nr:uncharacterized protein LOC120629452 [Pararge aegeria]
MVTLAGHLSVNFWERHVVQNKLSDMKNSLDHLKVTVHNMGYAYDDLQRDLLDLARINFKPSITSRESKTESCKRKRGLDHKILEHLNVLLDKVNVNQNLVADQKPESIQVSNRDLAKNATTVTRFPFKATAVGPGRTTVFKERPDENECIYNCRTKNSLRKCKEDCESSNLYQKF